MPSDAQKKANRLVMIEHLLARYPRGLTTRELSERLGVSQRTIQRDLLDLQAHEYSIKLVEDRGRWSLMDGSHARLDALRFTLPEATALALAARLLQRASDEQNRHVADAIVKLSTVLPMPIGEHLQKLFGPEAERNDQDFVRNFEALAYGWANNRTVRICYRLRGTSEEVETDLDVYCLEPIAPSFAFYAIGYSHYQQDLRTYKVERILHAELTEHTFERDPSFDPVAHLGSGWGIWGGADLQTVRLRFSREAAWRLREGRFHPTQQIQDQSDGSCIVTFKVAQPIEMAAFIRGWGPMVEVLEPAELREQIAQDAREMAAIYG